MHLHLRLWQYCYCRIFIMIQLSSVFVQQENWMMNTLLLHRNLQVWGNVLGDKFRLLQFKSAYMVACFISIPLMDHFSDLAISLLKLHPYNMEMFFERLFLLPLFLIIENKFAHWYDTWVMITQLKRKIHQCLKSTITKSIGGRDQLDNLKFWYTTWTKRTAMNITMTPEIS